ncbi:uncharacterized protein LOC113146748 [Cyclospora cayetanensis]|uniref:Uncharacterized protein LOC113146748 n=1 Tax=Cyclospora cayetanensis TaxID=88456 RepID=A0A6P6RSM6_9EIME|nr:uncharacterized protein LOC113146748 [Cyclospora cayetanensis]
MQPRAMSHACMHATWRVAAWRHGLVWVYASVGVSELFNSSLEIRIVPQLAILIWNWGFESSVAGPPVYAYGHGALQRPLSWGIFVTIAQISQMFVGVGVTVVSMYYAFTYPYKAMWRADQLADSLAHGQYITVKNLYWACLMYSTYFYLFAEYFVKRYVRGREQRAQKKLTDKKLE